MAPTLDSDYGVRRGGGGGRAKRISFEDALAYLPTLRELAADSSKKLEKADKDQLRTLVKVTVGWDNTFVHRTWQSAENDAHLIGSGHQYTAHSLRQAMREVLELFTQILVARLQEDPAWAAHSLSVLVDDTANLYDNRVSSYKGGGSYGTGGSYSSSVYGTGGGGSYMTQEGATFLKGVAAAAFAKAGGLEMLVAAVKANAGEPKTILGMVELVNGLMYTKWKAEEEAALGGCLAAAGEGLLQVPEKLLVERREEVQKSLKYLLQNTRAYGGAPKPASRPAIEAAWQSFIIAGLRSTNLQARRAAADMLADARRYGISAAELAPWLRKEGVLEELFGDRLDPRVLEELSLEPLCEPCAEGLRELLAGLERSLTHAVLYKKLHEFVTLAPETTPPTWGRDVVVIEIMRWVRNLLASGRVDAIGLVAGIFSCSSLSWGAGKDTSQKRVFEFVGAEATAEATNTLVAAMLVEGVTDAQLIALEAAFDDVRTQMSASDVLSKLLGERVSDLQACVESGGKPLATSAVRLLLRVLQSFPVTDVGSFSRQAAMRTHTGLSDLLFQELRLAMAADSAPPAAAVQWRIRTICFTHRCGPGLAMDASRLRAIVDLVRHLDDGAHVWYFLRIASPTGSASSKDANTHTALAEDAIAASLEIVEEWAKSTGLNMPGFFCLQQAIVLVNGHADRLRFLDKDGDPMGADIFAMSCIFDVEEAAVKGPPLQLVGSCVMVLQINNACKLATLGRYDEVTEQFSFEYIDEMVHRRKVATLAKVFTVPPILEQEPTIPRVEAVADPSSIAGSEGLWSCALGSGANASVGQKATDLLLALHQGSDGTRALLWRLLSRMSNDSPPSTLGRGLKLLNTLADQQPLTHRREHIGIGFPYRMKLIEYHYVWEEVIKHKAWWQSSSVSAGDDKETVRRRKQVSQCEIWVHSQLTLAELHELACATLGKRTMELFVRGINGSINSQGQQTLQELRYGLGRVMEAEAGNLGGRMASTAFDGPLDDLGDGEAAWPERLLDLLTNCGTLDSDNRSLCWQLLLRLPTHQGLAAQVRQPEGKPWSELLSHKKLWHSAYSVLLIDALISPLYEGSSGAVSPDVDMLARTADAERWFSEFAKAGGVEALITFFIDFMSTRNLDAGPPSKDTEFELGAVLPALTRAVGASIMSQEGGKEVLGADGGIALVKSGTQATKWLFEASKANREEGTGGWWVRMRLRYTAGAGLDLLVAAQKRAELPLEMVDSLVLPLLVFVAQEVEGHVNSRVVAAIVEVSRRPGATPLLLKRLAAAVPGIAAAAGDGSVPFFDIALEAMSALSGQISTEAGNEREEMTAVVSKTVLASRSNVPSLYRLLKALLKAGAGSSSHGKLVSDVGGPLAEHMVRCILPEQSKGVVVDDHTREQAAEALLHLLDAGDWELRCNVLRKVNGYLAETPTPDAYDFEPKAPKEPSTSLDGRRNETGHVGLVNRGMTCYMNSTVQQLFWSLPFRNAVLSAPPPLRDLTEKPEPLPDPNAKPEPKQKTITKADSLYGDMQGPSMWSFLSQREIEDVGPKKTPADVGWELQRMFAYLQDCQLGQFNTDTFVKACSCLNLEYAVTSQNDAAEFFDKLCDAADTMYQGQGSSDMSSKPAHIFLAKSCREKYCHNCNARTKGREDEQKRVQLSALCETLEECLDALCAAETMSGDNRVDCDHCGPKRDTTYRTYFTQLPQILVLNLARITFDLETLERVKKNPRIAFPDKLNMSKYTEDAVVNGSELVPGCQYELQGVQIHQGGASSGHYYSFAQNETGNWYKFNDDRVSPFSMEDLDAEAFGGEDYDKAAKGGRKFEKSYNAYMLYYRCVDAAPFSAHKKAKEATPVAADGDAAAAEAPPLTRSISEQVSPGATHQPPLLSRNVTHAFSGQRAAEKQKKRKQAQMKADLLEEIESINMRLHRQAIVFSEPTRQFMMNLIGKLQAEMGMAATAAGAPAAAAKALSARSAASEQICRLSSQVLFDVLMHAQGSTEKTLKPWVDLICQQFLLEGTEAPQWLLARLSGEFDQVLGSGPRSWLPKAIFECKGFDERFPPVAVVVVAAVEAALASGAGDSCSFFLEAMLSLMGSVSSATQLTRYGFLWARLTSTPSLGGFVAEHRGNFGSPVSTLLSHLYIGDESTPLAAPPAPALGKMFVGLSKTQAAYAPLIVALGALLSIKPELASEPMMAHLNLWRSLARQNPEVFAEEGVLRKIMPQEFEVLKVIAQTIVEALRPCGAEDLVLSAALRKALAYVLASGGEEELTMRLVVLSEVGLQLVETARKNSTKGSSYGSWGGSSYGGYGGGGGGGGWSSGGGGTGGTWSGNDGSMITTRRNAGGGGVSFASSPRNPEALQLLRLLQVVADLCPALPDAWAFAIDFIKEVLDRKSKTKWQKGGLPLDEVKGLADHWGLTDAIGASGAAAEEKIKVSGAGEVEANGEYVFSHHDDEDCPHYENVANGSISLYQMKNRYGDQRWIIEKEVRDGLDQILYRTEYLYAYKVDTPYPPTGAGDWKKVLGDLPAPQVDVILPK